MPEKNDWTIRNIITGFYKRNGMVEIYHTLRNTAQTLSFTLVHRSSIICKNIVSVFCKIICCIHIRIMASVTKSVGNDHYSVLVITVGIKITCKHLSLIGRKRILCTLQTFKILDTKHQWLIAVFTYIEIVIVHLYAENPPSDNYTNYNA